MIKQTTCHNAPIHPVMRLIYALLRKNNAGNATFKKKAHLHGFVKLILISFLFAVRLAAQTPAADTLAQARSLRADGKLRQAEKLLNHWCAAHSTDASAFWLRAQNDYWRKNFRKSSRHFQRAIALDPQNLYLKLDFAEAQLNMGQFWKAEKRLSKLNGTERKDPHCQYVVAKGLFWAGDILSAKKLARAAQKSGSKNAPDLLREIELASSPWAAGGGDYATDSQPLESFKPILAAGFFRSKWLDLRFRVSGQRFLIDSFSVDALHFELGNRVRFPKMGTTLGAAAGTFQLKNQKMRGIADLEIAQRLPFGLSINLSAAQKPYLHTLASLDTGIFFKKISGEIEWREPHGFWAKAGGKTEIFEDKNEIKTFWAWAMTPPIKIWRFAGRLGYSYSFSDATEDRFFSEKTLAELLAPWDSTVQIPGRYAPYFTPEKMGSHAALAVLDCRFAKSISLAISGKYGFWASAMNPYLHLDLDSTNVVFIHREFQKTSFTPLEIGAKLAVQFSDRVSGEANYLFSRNFFYEIQTAGGRVKLIF